MNRFQKKCLLASTGLHGFLVLLLVFGSAFFVSKEKPSTQRLNVVPTHLIEDALAGGGGNPNRPRTEDRQKGETLVPLPAAATPPQPTPPQPKPSQAEPPQPKVEVKRPEPKKADPLPPKPTEAAKPKPTDKIPEPKPRIDLADLKPIARTDADKQKAKKEAEAREAAREAARQEAAANAARQKLAQQIGKAVGKMQVGFSSGTEVDVGGPGGEAYANYGAFVQAVYEDAWKIIQDLDDEEAVAGVRVTIARDGRVLSASLVQRSRNASLNKSVQRALDSVKHIGRPFPDSSKDSERTFNIKFNLKAKRLLG